MFIALEGIDGAGKTTTAERLIDLLQTGGVSVRFVRHGGVHNADPYLANYLRSIRELQMQSLQGPYRTLGDTHWALIRASYYALVDHCVVGPTLRAGDVVVADGWFYKFIAKLTSNGASLNDTESYFTGVRVPDRVFLLDVPASLAARRKPEFDPSELGEHRNHPNGHVAAFTSFQSLVRKQLLRMSQRHDWEVFDGSAGTTNDLAEKICARLGLPATKRRIVDADS
ncbi:hypothetical protein I0C86_13260 [Plantactinospora sp. S1510]|uniref:Thymidylate kinase n=1 Tax=Plantactinospora alkalitolerans TaxID=2789879 RepID=A0ABS0GV95_9ACTN|nr:hypothetical protein [Plantactinospora alkalitolerans]MBF9129923.1 hypothetical protein [Plantactinospora alkalitolerans]